ncbi:MAG: antitoxin [Actinomycetota bacterium]|nr:antitoxin [Actinomycetota bacterium]
MALEHRLEILLDADRHARLVAAAQQRGVSVAAVVREAIDRGLRAPDIRRRAAASPVLAAEPMPFPDSGALAVELADLRTRRA